MSYYKMNINGNISLGDYTNIHDYMEIVKPEDDFIITLQSSNDENAAILCNILESDKFNILSRESCNDGCYQIEAVKKR